MASEIKTKSISCFSPCTNWKEITGKRKGKKAGREDLKLKIISLIFLVLFGTYPKHSTGSLPRLDILPKACKGFLSISHTKADSSKERGGSCVASLCRQESSGTMMHLGWWCPNSNLETQLKTSLFSRMPKLCFNRKAQRGFLQCGNSHLK